MNQYMKSYQVVMRTVGPVFVGSGKEIGKKEYVFLNRKQVGITDIQGLYNALQKRRKEEAFEEYLLGKGKSLPWALTPQNSALILLEFDFKN